MDGALKKGVFKGDSGIPSAWLGPARNQLQPEELQKRTTINWNVPKVSLERLLSDFAVECRSPPKYVKGTGIQLWLSKGARQQAGPVGIGVYLTTCHYTQHGVVLAPPRQALTCHMEIRRWVPSKDEAELVTSDTATISSKGWGRPDIISANTPADLEPYLVDGCLRLSASVTFT
jgi:hypothetical protein